MKRIEISTRYTPRVDPNVTRYFKDIKKISKTIDKFDERDLLYKIKNGDVDAYHKLIQANLRFVVSVAKRYQGRGLDLIDLINEGNCGLAKAATEYDLKQNVKFISYAVWWIQQAILKAIYDKASTVYYPTGKSVLMHRIKKSMSTLSEKLERDPTIEEISQHSEIPEATVSTILKLIQKQKSLDEEVEISNDDSISLGDKLAGDYTSDEECEINSNNIVIQDIINDIPDKRISDIIKLLFGIGVQRMTLDEIAMRFNMCSERVRQLKEDGIKWLRDNKSDELKELL